ncbi:MAG: GGDEF domain-containing protein [Candidatus Thiodiazotropha taylori]
MKLDENQKNGITAIFDSRTNENVSECFRLSLSFLTKYQILGNPVNFALFYHYAAGDDKNLIEAMDEYLKQGKIWSDHDANQLFERFIHGCENEFVDNLREEILSVTAHTIGSMVDIVGSTAVSNKKIKAHINHLAESKNVSDVLGAVKEIISETRELATETTKLEQELTDSSSVITKLMNELAQIKRQAIYDTLTGVLNRRGFDEKLSTLISNTKTNRDANFCMILIDLDHFKRINDQYGHISGDKVLFSIGKLLSERTKGLDNCARFGGEEFAILMPETQLTNAYNVAENLRILVTKIKLKRPSTGEIIDDISASFGVGAYRSGEEKEDFLDRCDKALYRAKRLGRDRVIIAD